MEVTHHMISSGFTVDQALCLTGTGNIFRTITLSEAFVTQYKSDFDTDGAPSISFQIQFAKISDAYFPADSGKAVTVSYDIAKNALITS